MKEFKDSQSMQELCQLTYDMWLHGWDEYNGGNVSYILPEEDREYLKFYAVKKEVELSDLLQK